MRPHELEIWIRDIVEALSNGHAVEDTRVELKAAWIAPREAAKRLAGHANAARGAPILWVIGVDERNNTVSEIDPMELATWYMQVQRCFDGESPHLDLSMNIFVGERPVVGMYFETERYAPFVVKNPEGGYPEFSVPWRDGTRLRAAKREDLLRLLVPIIKQPRITMAGATLKLWTQPNAGSFPIQQKHTWKFESFIYITPADEARVVIPYGVCAIWMTVEGYSTTPYRLSATFDPFNINAGRPVRAAPYKFGNLEIDMSRPPPRESFTIRCADSELLADGPGSARLVGNGFLLRDELSVPTGNVSIYIEITPSSSERKIIFEKVLTPVMQEAGKAEHEWRE